MMVKLNTFCRLQILLFCIGILASGKLYAQSEKNDDKSTIVMTKSELNSFLITIADARRAELKKRNARNAQQDLVDLRTKYQQQNRTQQYGSENVSNQDILRELRYLNQRIDNLSPNNNAFPSNNRDNSTVIMPSNSGNNPVYTPNDRSSMTVISTNNKKIAALQFTIDSLKNADSGKGADIQKTKFSDSLTMMKGRISDVRREMQNLELKLKASEKLTKKEDSDENKTYFKQQVYFDNNSQKLGEEYLKYVQDLTQILIKFPDAKVMLEGWASPLGTAVHNKQLSMRRTESVERAFTNNGIDNKRIISAFRGEDKTSSAQHARRVDMSIMVR